MAKTEENLQEFVNGLQAAFGDRLVSAVLYGSAARGDAYTPQSDLNVLVLLKVFSLQALSSAEKAVRHGAKVARIAPIFWTEDELKNSSDVFPVEFTEMVQHHKVLYGADPLAGLKIDASNLRHQVEFELRGKLLRLRSEWLEFRSAPKARLELLIRAGTSFMVLFEQTNLFLSGKLDSGLAEPFRECVLLKKKEIRLGPDALIQLFQDVHEAARKIIQSIDKL